MLSQLSSNKRIAKNASVLYMRLLITMLISLYTTRVVLNVMGVEDYGIYNVTGSIIVLFSFVSSTMGTTTQRFLSFELGKNDIKRTKNVFTQSVYSYFVIITFVIVIGETIGLWILNHTIQIPESRIYAANIAYHFSVLTFITHVINAPFVAAIIAMERMEVFAYGNIAISIFDLVSVILLQVSQFEDALITYSIFVFAFHLIVTLMYYWFCTRHFEFCRIRMGKVDVSLIRQMIVFAFWNMIGTLTNLLKDQGVNILTGMFFNPSIIAARAIAVRVNYAVLQFSNNVYTAARPQLVKCYSAGRIREMLDICYKSSRLSFFLMSALLVPLFCEMDRIMIVWLKEVPDYSVIFCKIVLMGSLLGILAIPLDHMMQATGKLKKMQISVCSINILCIPVSYLFFIAGYGPEYALYINLVLLIVSLLPRLSICKKEIKMSLIAYYKNVIQVLFYPFILSIVWYFIYREYCLNYLNVYIGTIINILVVFAIIYFIGLSKSEKELVFVAVKRMIRMIC